MKDNYYYCCRCVCEAKTKKKKKKTAKTAVAGRLTRAHGTHLPEWKTNEFSLPHVKISPIIIVVVVINMFIIHVLISLRFIVIFSLYARYVRIFYFIFFFTYHTRCFSINKETKRPIGFFTDSRGYYTGVCVCFARAGLLHAYSYVITKKKKKNSSLH